jgi:hypothetical protein
VRDSAHLAYALCRVGLRAEAERIVRTLVESSARRYVPPFHIAIAYTGLGDANAAFAWLQRGYTERGSFMDGSRGHTRLRSPAWRSSMAAAAPPHAARALIWHRPHGFRGSRMVNVVPSAAVERSDTAPPCAATMRSTM